MYNQIASNKRKSWLLIAGFITLVVLLGYFLSNAVANGSTMLIIATVIALGMTATSWWAGDRIALASAGAKPLQKEADPELFTLIENLSITAGIPTPKIYLIPDLALNAFATGRDPAHASVAVTTGLRQHLTRTELEGVLAHELSHVKNFDTRYLMLTMLLVGFVALISDIFLRAQWLGGIRNERQNQGGAVLLLLGLLFAILAPLTAKLIQFAVSRRREYLADASGVLLTRYPDGLISALKKINLANKQTQTASTATAPLYFAHPFGGSKKTNRLTQLMSTHPPIADRIAALEYTNA